MLEHCESVMEGTIRLCLPSNSVDSQGVSKDFEGTMHTTTNSTVLATEALVPKHSVIAVPDSSQTSKAERSAPFIFPIIVGKLSDAFMPKLSKWRFFKSSIVTSLSALSTSFILLFL